MKETVDVVAKLKNRKAPGRNGVTNRDLKIFPHRTILFLVLLLNGALRLSHFPKAWKKANVVMLHKKEKEIS